MTDDYDFLDPCYNCSVTECAIVPVGNNLFCIECMDEKEILDYWTE